MQLVAAPAAAVDRAGAARPVRPISFLVQLLLAEGEEVFMKDEKAPAELWPCLAQLYAEVIADRTVLLLLLDGLEGVVLFLHINELGGEGALFLLLVDVL